MRKICAVAVVAGMALGFTPFGFASADAATVSKDINLSCRTNGAPMKYNVTRPMSASMRITAPANVKAGQDAVVRVDYTPEPVPGKESIATMKQLRDIVLRFTLDSPSAFKTARVVGGGQHMATGAKISLVGGSLLVLSGMNVNVNGQDTAWVPPSFEIVMTAPADGNTLGTLHPAVEGAAGEFNNPGNALTMKTVTDSILGELVIQLNCQALSGGATFHSIPVVGADKPKPTTTSKKPKKTTTSKTKASKTKASKSSDKKATESTSAAPKSTDASGLEILDEDIYEEENMESKTPGGLIAVIVIACLAVAGGIGYGVYRGVKKKKAKDA